MKIKIYNCLKFDDDENKIDLVSFLDEGKAQAYKITKDAELSDTEDAKKIIIVVNDAELDTTTLYKMLTTTLNETAEKAYKSVLDKNLPEKEVEKIHNKIYKIAEDNTILKKIYELYGYIDKQIHKIFDLEKK